MAISCGAAPCTGIDHQGTLHSALWESFCATSGFILANRCRPVLSFHLHLLLSLCSFTSPLPQLPVLLWLAEWLEYFCFRAWILSGFEAAVNQWFIISVTSDNFVGKRTTAKSTFKNKYWDRHSSESLCPKKPDKKWTPRLMKTYFCAGYMGTPAGGKKIVSHLVFWAAAIRLKF